MALLNLIQTEFLKLRRKKMIWVINDLGDAAGGLDYAVFCLSVFQLSWANEC